MKLSVGVVTLRVADLDTVTAFYQSALGLQVREQEADRVVLGTATDDLLALIGSPDAVRDPGTVGLYHFALRVPARSDLARVLMHLARARTPLHGLSDHYVSEAIYLADPEDNGIEIYHDRPASTWFNSDELHMGTVALDIDDLFAELTEETASFKAMPAGTDMGHVHLHVGAVPAAEAFYRDVLGFESMMNMGTAVFLAYDRYHHHLGANTWGGRRPAQYGALGLDHVIFRVHDEAVYNLIRQRVVGTPALLEDQGNAILLSDPFGLRSLIMLVHEGDQV